MTLHAIFSCMTGHVRIVGILAGFLSSDPSSLSTGIDKNSVKSHSDVYQHNYHHWATTISIPGLSHQTSAISTPRKQVPVNYRHPPQTTSPGQLQTPPHEINYPQRTIIPISRCNPEQLPILYEEGHEMLSPPLFLFSFINNMVILYSAGIRRVLTLMALYTYYPGPPSLSCFVIR